MDQADKVFYKNILMKQKDDIFGTVKKMDDHGIGNPDEFTTDELSLYDNHPADIGTQLYNLGMNINLRKHEMYEIKEIDEALKRIDSDSYGICEYCSKEIGRDRLEVRPQARLCIECAKSRDVDMDFLERERPIEEKVLAAPFDRGYPDEADDDEYEGLDQWNDVMKYGSSSSPQDMGVGGHREYKEFYTNKTDKQGIVDAMDDVSNEEYERQLPD